MRPRKIVLGFTGASGAVYGRALVEALSTRATPSAESAVHAIHRPRIELAAVLSQTAAEVWEQELPPGSPQHDGGLIAFLASRNVAVYQGRDYRAPFASGSAKWEAMVVIPCSMSTLAKVAHGISDDLLTRAADVMLKEQRRLLLVTRETPLSAIHLENMLTVTRAGAMVIPASPSFYGRPSTVAEVVATVIARVLDQLGIENGLALRWQTDDESSWS